MVGWGLSHKICFKVVSRRPSTSQPLDITGYSSGLYDLTGNPDCIEHLEWSKQLSILDFFDKLFGFGGKISRREWGIKDFGNAKSGVFYAMLLFELLVHFQQLFSVKTNLFIDDWAPTLIQTVANLLITTQYLSVASNNNYQTNVSYTDLAKGFDRVDPEMLQRTSATIVLIVPVLPAFNHI